jgi:hypothetical protein
MAYRFLDPMIGGQRVNEKSSTQNHPLGMIAVASDATLGGAEFVYLKGVASTAVGSWVSYTPGTGVTTLAVAGLKGAPLAVSMTTNTTTTSYAWYQISGTATALGLTSITASSGFIFLTATSGNVDDASVAGDLIIGAKKTATVHVVGTFLDTYHIARPMTTDRITLPS